MVIYRLDTVRKELKWHKAGEKGAKKDIPKVKVETEDDRSPFVLLIKNMRNFLGPPHEYENLSQRHCSKCMTGNRNVS